MHEPRYTRSTRRRLTVALAIPALAMATAGSLEGQSPEAGTLSELPQGLRIRTNGPGVRDAVGLSLGDVLRGGLMTLVVRPPADGVVVGTTSDSLRFADGGGGQVVSVPWSGVDWVDAYRGRSVGLGTVQGIGLGALTGLVGWGVIELIFLAADNPVVDEPEIVIGIGAAAGALVGAASLGDRWDRVYSARAQR